MLRTTRILRRLALAMLVAAVGCYSSGPGDDPDDASLYFPVGLAVSDTGKTLFVVNSDFDLRYNAGTVEAFDEEAIARAVKQCESTPDGPMTAACASSDPHRFVRASVRIGAFAASISAGPRYAATGEPIGAGHGRLFVPVRGDATITYVDYDESPGAITLTCSQAARPNELGRACSSEWRIGQNSADNSRKITLEGEPYAVALPGYWPPPSFPPSPPDTRPVVLEPRHSHGIAAVIHQSSGDVSVLVDTSFVGERPRLAFTLGGLPTNATGIAPLDFTDGLNAQRRFIPRFLVTNRSQPSVTVVSFLGTAVGVSGEEDIDRSALVISDSVPIPTNGGGYDTRGVVVDPPNPADDEPYRTRPIRVFLTNRSPNGSLIAGRVDPTDGRLHFHDVFPLPIGPSRLARAATPDVDALGRKFTHTRIYATAFDARALVSFDPEVGRVSNIVQGIGVAKGPYAMVVDPVQKLGFMANFTQSCIQVVDLDPTVKDSAGNTVANPFFEQIVFTVGVPTDPRS